VRESGDQILFLHRLQPGAADRSYGIEVGRLAGLPEAVIARVRRILGLLEGEQLVTGLRQPPAAAEARGAQADQLALFAPAQHPVIERLAFVDVNALTPLQALALLAELNEAVRHAR
jgi:DNA mismatch repair protein MutS